MIDKQRLLDYILNDCHNDDCLLRPCAASDILSIIRLGKFDIKDENLKEIHSRIDYLYDLIKDRVKEKTCKWESKNNCYYTKCGDVFDCFEDNFIEDNFIFCPNCGEKIEVKKD